ncbi:complex I NDUFA9 subunit family protein [Lutimaribacter pacificus]|uniref:complex I NDUFA9 subunit family protein n=1 Tax=Lutimaribacter pacificus TaxID=391948 RepID=UPI0021D51592|nr:complex I NDUFA9 subunit family protein [Lutimaribacter pacificus]
MFGGTGFLGRRIVRHLLRDGRRVRIVARHAQHATQAGEAGAEVLCADITNAEDVARAVKGSEVVVNAVSLYTETAAVSFDDIHVAGAGRVAAHCTETGVRRLVHISGIGSDPEAGDAYVRARGRGEAVVREACPDAVIARPAVMFAQGEALVGTILRLLRRMPIYPLFGDGETRLQPAHVGDVSRAVANALQVEDAQPVYDLGGPQVYTYRDLVQAIARSAGLRAHLLPVPFPLWYAMALGAERLPGAPLTRHQVALMERDNIADKDGMRALQVTPRRLEPIVQEIVQGR